MVILKRKNKNQKKQDKQFDEMKSIVDVIGSSPKSKDAHDIFLNKRLQMINEWFQTHQSRYFISAYLFVVSIFVIIYLILPTSKVIGYYIDGNHYLTDIYAKRLLKDNTSQFALMNLEPIVQYNLKKNPWIQDVFINLDRNRILNATIVENKPIGYYINDDLETIIVFADGQQFVSNAYTTDTLAKIPLIVHFNEEQIPYLVSAFKDVDSVMIESIAEIDRLDLSYDTNSLILTMADGNYFIGSRFGMDTLNRYRLIASKLNGNGHCLYATDNQSVVYKSACPWVEPEEKPVDYFLDCEGQPILDHLGNPIAIQYLTDAHGNYIYDSRGHKTITNQIEMPNCEVVEEQENTTESQQNG